MSNQPSNTEKKLVDEKTMIDEGAPVNPETEPEVLDQPTDADEEDFKEPADDPAQ